MSRLLLLLLVALPQAAWAEQVHYAIVIGNNAPPSGTSSTSQKVPNGLRQLRYADDDAVRYYELFSMFAKTRLLTTLDAESQRRYPHLAERALPPSLNNLKRLFTDFAQQMKDDRARGDEPIFYLAFSGHGARQNSKAYLAMADGGLTQAVLYEELIASLPARWIHLLIDACHAGGVVGVRGFFASEQNADTQAVLEADLQPVLDARPLARYPNVGVLLAASLGQEAHEWSRIESGVFTHELLSGLLGPADINGDLKIEYTEAQAFVASASREIKDRRAIPQIIARPPRAHRRAPLIELRALARGPKARILQGDASAMGHFYIELENGQRYLDAHLAKGPSTTIVLPSGKAFVRTQASEARIPQSRKVRFAQLRLAPKRSAERGSIDEALHASLFASTFSKSYYQGFVDSISALPVDFSNPPRPIETAQLKLPRRDAVLWLTGAGLGLTSAAIFGGLAHLAKRDFENTNLQRPARAAKRRYQGFLGASISAGLLAAGAGIAGWLLWPNASEVIALPRIGPSRLALEFAFVW